MKVQQAHRSDASVKNVQQGCGLSYRLDILSIRIGFDTVPVGVLKRQPPQPGNRSVSEPLISI